MSSITLRSQGKTIDLVLKCDNLLELRFTDGTCLKVGWRDDNGDLIKGAPDLLFEGTHIRTKPVLVQRHRVGQ